jgi:hypothetical protein
MIANKAREDRTQKMIYGTLRKTGGQKLRMRVRLVKM